ncbi:unnamed protein product [Linum trigynum]|uniref:Uncharacterized protein n=1 Tax=Linum trigynum TaxID=586398 RepID=A0AAV2G1J1_9ROSI
MPSPPPSTKSLEICRVTPPPDSPESSAQFPLPLTFFDTFWLKFPPVERIFFYRLSSSATSSPSEFQSTVVPRLKRSLSVALLRFLPLAGNLTWPADTDVPFILYTPGDGVSVTVAESTSAEGDDFDLLSGDGPRDAILSRAYVPKLAVSGPNAAVLALQVTLFPKKGFCIGVTCHHAVLDGKSTVMFLKAWAHISDDDDDGEGMLPDELTPSLDRTAIKDPDGIALEDVKTWTALCAEEDSPRSLALLPEAMPTADKSSQLRGTFKLSRQDIQKLKQSVIRYLEKDDDEKRLEMKPNNNLSTFVITYAYTLVCMAKAKGSEDEEKKAFFGFTADCRSRLDPPLPSNYFGNCVMAFAAGQITVRDLVHEGGIAAAAHRLVEVIRPLEKGVLVGAKGKLARLFGEAAATKEVGALIGVGVAGSPRFGVYGVDFGYGRPEKVEITSIDRTSAMSMAESGDGSGGVEVGVVMERHEMEEFTSAFFDGLKHI